MEITQEKRADHILSVIAHGCEELMVLQSQGWHPTVEQMAFILHIRDRLSSHDEGANADAEE